MATQDSDDPLRSNRLSPGEAAFERLSQRDVLSSKSPSRPERFPTTALPSTGSSAMPETSATESESGLGQELLSVDFDSNRGTEESFVVGAATDDAVAMHDDAVGSSGGEAVADTLEATLLSQLRALEETLQEPAPVVAPTAPRRRPMRAEPSGVPGRSAFAPDPVRQRSYVDLRDPAPSRPVAEDAPWRKYLSEPGSRPAARTVRRVAAHPSRTRPPAPPAASPEESRERSRSFRAITLAAILGLGVGVGLLVLFRPVGEVPAPVATLEPEQPMVVASTTGHVPDSAPAPSVGQALETLLASESPRGSVAHEGPAVIAEAGTSPEALADTVASIPPPVIAPIVATPIQVARGPVAYGPDAPAMAYGPMSEPAYDPAAESLIRDPVAAATEEALAPTPAASGRGSLATVASSVNMRARPQNGAAVVAVLAQGLSVQVLGCDHWCEIEAGGKRGYVYKKFVGR